MRLAETAVKDLCAQTACRGAKRLLRAGDVRGLFMRSFFTSLRLLVAASVAALTVYDMCKALDKGIEIREVVLQRKSGGKSGDYVRKK